MLYKHQIFDSCMSLGVFENIFQTAEAIYDDDLKIKYE
jgi:hypothetical protein